MSQANWRVLLDLIRTFETRQKKGPRAIPRSGGAKLQAQYRFAIIQPLLQFRDMGDCSLRNEDGSAPRNMEELAKLIARQHQLSRATVWRWYGLLRTEGFAALVDRPRSDRGTSRFFASQPKARAFVEEAYLTHRLSLPRVHAHLVSQWHELSTENCAPPSCSTVRAYLNSLPKLIIVLGRKGEKAFAKLTGFSSAEGIERFRRVTWVN